MSTKTFWIRVGLAGGISSLLWVFVYACAFSGLESDLPKPLGTFHGRAIGELPHDRGNPRLAVAWQSTSGDLSFWEGGSAAIDSQGPGHFVFTGNFSTLPDTGISGGGSDFVVGQLWLYSDANNNGFLDWRHPADYDNTQAAIADAGQHLKNAMASLLTYADAIPVPTVNLDSFRVKNGSLYVARSPLSSAIINHDASGNVWGWEALLRARFRVLYHPNKWEGFFNPDGNFSSKGFRRTVSGADTMVWTSQLVRYQPHSGRENDFEQALQNATLDQALLDSLVNEAKNKINQVMQPGLFSQTFEKVMGRSADYSRQDYIVYFSSQASLGMMAEAEKASGFFFALKEDLKVGFNLVECDYQHNCSVQNWDSVKVFLGDQSPAMVFSPPSASPMLFVNPADSTSFDDTANVQKYDLQYVNPFSADSLQFLNYIDRGFWASIPPYGLLPFNFAGKGTFFCHTPSLTIELRFISKKDESSDSEDVVLKMIGVAIDSTKNPPDSLGFYSLNPQSYDPRQLQNRIQALLPVPR